MSRNLYASAALTVALLGGAGALAPLPAAAQQQGPSATDGRGDPREGWERQGDRSQQRRGGGRDYVDSYDPPDPYDRYLRSPGARDDGPQQRGRAANRDAGDGSRAAMERYAREQFDRGYQTGREEERRRRAAQYSGGGGGSPSPSASGRDGDIDRYFVIPDFFPETPRYRGMQDFVLIPDRSRSMDWLFSAAQSLREAVQVMAQQPPSERRDRAMDRAREALLETQQAMVQLPPELRTR